MNPKRKRFCEEYLKDLSGTDAAIRAGYNKRSARCQASQILAISECQEYIKELQSKISKRNEITIDDLIQDLNEIRKADLKALYDDNGQLRDIKDLPPELRHAIQELNIFSVGELKTVTKYKLYSKLEAIEKLARHLGFYEEDNKQKTPTIFQIEITGDADQNKAEQNIP